jgi:hypothetical protein
MIMLDKFWKIIATASVALMLLAVNANASKEVAKEPVPEKGFVIGTHTVADFEVWKKGFLADIPNQEKVGIKSINILRDVDKPNDVTITFEVSDLAKAKAFFSSPEKSEYMKKLGVISKPDIKYLKIDK